MSYSGYDLPFDPEPDLRYHCPVCLAVLKQPVQTKCGHRFCKACLQSIASGYSRPIKCPIDKTAILCSNPRDLFMDIATEREVQSLTLKCSNYSIGCTWRGELRDIYKHLDECLEDMMSCHLNCGMRFKRNNEADHPNKCPKRVVNCPNCEVNITASDLPKHQLLECMKLPVECMLCGMSGLLREAIPSHIDCLEGDCPAVVINCKFSNLGCTFQDQRSNMALHYHSTSIQHLSLVSASLKNLNQNFNDIIVENRDLRSCLNILNSRVDEKANLLSELCSKLDYVSKEIAENYTGNTIWKISLSSISQINSQLFGPIFYSGNPGYKIQVLIETGPNNSIPVFKVKFLKGIFHHMLPIYFSGTIKIKLLNQTSRNNHFTRKVHLFPTSHDTLVQSKSLRDLNADNKIKHNIQNIQEFNNKESIDFIHDNNQNMNSNINSTQHFENINVNNDIQFQINNKNGYPLTANFTKSNQRILKLETTTCKCSSSDLSASESIGMDSNISSLPSSTEPIMENESSHINKSYTESNLYNKNNSIIANKDNILCNDATSSNYNHEISGENHYNHRTYLSLNCEQIDRIESNLASNFSINKCIDEDRQSESIDENGVQTPGIDLLKLDILAKEFCENGYFYLTVKVKSFKFN